MGDLLRPSIFEYLKVFRFQISDHFAILRYHGVHLHEIRRDAHDIVGLIGWCARFLSYSWSR